MVAFINMDPEVTAYKCGTAGKLFIRKIMKMVLPEVLDVPRVSHGDSILGLQADGSGPGDLDYPIRAFPLDGFSPLIGYPKWKVEI